jgi:hypothetical protein
MSLVRHTAWIASNAPGYEAWAPWLALPAPRPCP